MKKGEDYVGVTIVFFCHDGAGDFLMNLRSENCRDEHHRWDPGGGGLEHGDTVDTTLAQEIAQEYCTTIIGKEFLGFRDVHREHEGRKTHWIALDFLVHVDRATVKNGEPPKFADIGWFRLDSLPTPLSRAMESFLGKYRERLARSA